MKHINKNCNHCGDKLVLGENFKEHRLKKRDYICSPCFTKYQLDFYSPENSMYVNNKYISKKHPLWKPGQYKTFEDAAFSSLAKYEATTEGQVYIITNKAWKGWIKVGMAIDAEDRCNGYQTSSPHRDYKLKFKKDFNNRRSAEAKAHELCELEAKERNGEWFKLSTRSAIKIINNITEEQNEKETA